MAGEQEALRDWHRLFGLLLTDFFTDSPFTVDIERDLSQQQQLLDVLILRRGRGRFRGRLPDGWDNLMAHNLVTFKSHHEALDAWAIKELIGHFVAYRKLVSPTPSALLPEEQFRLYGVCARFPHNLAAQVPLRQRQPGVYECNWGTDVIRVTVARELPREPHNAPLHLFSASPELVGFGGSTYRRRSERTSRLLGDLLGNYQEEDTIMPFTMKDYDDWFVYKHFGKLPLEKKREILETLPPEQRQALMQSLPMEERLAGLSAEEIREYLKQQATAKPRQPRRKKERRTGAGRGN